MTARYARLCILLAWLVLAPQAAAQDKSPAKWLVDIGRDYGLGRERLGIEPEAEVILAWMDAAVRVDPALAEPYRWKSDLLERLDRHSEAQQAMRNYCQRAPDDVVSLLGLIQSELDDLQSLEDRMRYCARRLLDGDLPRAAQGDLHRRIGQYYYNLGDTKRAVKYLHRALALFDFDHRAKGLLLTIQGDDVSDVECLKFVIDQFIAQPAEFLSYWQLAKRLDALNLHDQAIDWYLRGRLFFNRTYPQEPLPDPYIFDMARSYFDAGKYAEARRILGDLTPNGPESANADFLGIQIAGKTGRSDDATDLIAKLREKYEAVEDQVRASNDHSRATEIAWFYCRYDPNPAKAMEFAAIATSDPWAAPEAKRAMGFAALMNDDLTLARETLEPLAGDDQLADICLARTLLASELKDQALATLEKAAKIRYSGLAYEEIQGMFAELQAECPAPPERSAELNCLRSLPTELTNYAETPENFLRCTAAADSTSVPVFDRIQLTIGVENTSQFPVSIGPGFMLSGQFLVAAKMADSSDVYGDTYVPVNLDSRRAIKPGEKIEVTQTFDVGPISRLLRSRPQAYMDVRFTVIPEPYMDVSGKWKPHYPSLTPSVVRVTRAAFSANSHNMAALLKVCKSGSRTNRTRAVVVLAGLLAEGELARRNALSYPFRKIEPANVERALLAMLSDADYLVRAHTLQALKVVNFNASIASAAAKCLSDPHWLVRMCAIDLFADRQGPEFDNVVQRLAEVDSDPTVKSLAASYHQVWATATVSHSTKSDSVGTSPCARPQCITPDPSRDR